MTGPVASENSEHGQALVLSLFTGAGLLDLGFELEGFCVVSAGDILGNRDVRRFTAPRHKFAGIIGGPPCQEFSKARRAAPIKPYACDVATRAAYGYGEAMLREYVRIVTEAQPEWFLCENVPGVPDVTVPGFVTQRFNINARELGMVQNRLRCIQFGSRDGAPLVIPRGITPAESHRCVMASEGRRGKSMSPRKAAELQGLPCNWSLPGLSREGQLRAIGNGVPIPLGRALARAVLERHRLKWTLYCVCGCGAPVRRGVTLATMACRKRMSRRKQALDASRPRPVTPELFPAIVESQSVTELGHT